MWLGIAIVIVWAVGGLLALNPLPWHIRKYWDAPGERELRIIQAVALLLIVAGVTVFFVTEPGTFWHDLWPEMISTGGAVLGIDELNRRRSAQEYKQGIILQMASRSNDFALDAARIAKNEGWLQDGTFVGANLVGANLTGADLTDANLTGTNLEKANLIGAKLNRANLTDAGLLEANLTGANLMGAILIERAYLWCADFTDADLYRANLRGAELVRANLTQADLERANLMDADLLEANLTGAYLARANLTETLYFSNTQWPEDFDYKSKGAVNWEELSRQERDESNE